LAVDETTVKSIPGTLFTVGIFTSLTPNDFGLGKKQKRKDGDLTTNSLLLRIYRV
jgi:hypothetical protein